MYRCNIEQQRVQASMPTGLTGSYDLYGHRHIPTPVVSILGFVAFVFNQSSRLSIHSLLHPSAYPSVCLSIRLCPPARPPARPSVRPSVHPSIRPSIRPSARSAAHPLTHLSNAWRARCQSGREGCDRVRSRHRHQHASCRLRRPRVLRLLRRQRPERRLPRPRIPLCRHRRGQGIRCGEGCECRGSASARLRRLWLVGARDLSLATFRRMPTANSEG